MTDEAGSVLAGNPEPAVAPVADVATPQPIAAPEWAAEFPDDVKTVVANKAWKSPADAITSYANLEKLLGADKAGRALVPPKDDATPEEWGAFWGKLGKPETAEAYGLTVPEGDSGEFLKTASTWMHEANLTTKQAGVLAEKWNAFQQAQMVDAEKTFAQQSAVEVLELKQDWGPQFEAQAELGRRAIRESGLSSEDAIAIEKALGVKKAAQAFAKLGAAYREAPMKGGDSPSHSQFATTPVDAKARINHLKADKEFGKRLIEGDTGARAEWARLHQIAAGN